MSGMPTTTTAVFALATALLLALCQYVHTQTSFVDIHYNPDWNGVVDTKIMWNEEGFADGNNENRSGVCRLASPHGMQLVQGTSVALIADTDNNAIRMVDLGFTQESRNVSVSLTSMPYAVKLDREQKHLFIVNMLNGTLVMLDLFEGSLFVVASGLGKPTDVAVHPPTGQVFVADGQNHTLWVINMTTGTRSWFCGANDPAEGYYAEGSAAQSRFWVPLGLTYDDKRDVLYVADFRNRVIRFTYTHTHT